MTQIVQAWGTITLNWYGEASITVRVGMNDNISAIYAPQQPFKPLLQHDKTLIHQPLQWCWLERDQPLYFPFTQRNPSFSLCVAKEVRIPKYAFLTGALWRGMHDLFMLFARQFHLMSECCGSISDKEAWTAQKGAKRQDIISKPAPLLQLGGKHVIKPPTQQTRNHPQSLLGMGQRNIPSLAPTASPEVLFHTTTQIRRREAPGAQTMRSAGNLRLVQLKSFGYAPPCIFLHVTESALRLEAFSVLPSEETQHLPSNLLGSTSTKSLGANEQWTRSCLCLPFSFCSSLWTPPHFIRIPVHEATHYPLLKVYF